MSFRTCRWNRIWLNTISKSTFRRFTCNLGRSEALRSICRCSGIRKTHSQIEDFAQSMPHVVVIGGGFAGLAAAKTLQDSQAVTVTLLEASSDVGGRAKAIELPDGQKAELGATWLHGIHGHPVYNLAVEYGLMSAEPTKGRKVSKENAGHADRWAMRLPGTNFWKGAHFAREGESKALKGAEAKLVSHIISEFAHAVDRSEDSKAHSLGDHLEKEYAELSNKYEAESREAEIVRDAWAWRELLQRGIDGYDATEDGNPEGLSEYEDLPGPWPPVTGGYQAVAKRAAKDLKDVELNSEVVELDWSGEGVIVTCRNGSKHHADFVVCTVSLGVLKERHQTMFKPALPLAKIAAIQKLGIGVVDKIFVTFDGLSKDASRRYEFLWNNKSAKPPSGAATSGQSAIESCFSDSRPSSQNGANEHNERQSWHRGLYSLRLGGAEFITQNTTASSPKHLGESATDLPHVLNAEDSSNSDSDEEAGTTEEEKAAGRTGVMWITGHHAVAMERADDETLIRALNTCFDSFPALDIPRNFKVSRSNWGLDPFSRGSYSYVATESSVQDVSTLYEPLSSSHSGSDRPVVCFAGEATCLKHIGTTAGAFISGVREANRILDCLEHSGPGADSEL